MNTYGRVVWITGLPGSGKSTVAKLVVKRLSVNEEVISLDGDVLRRVFNNQEYDTESRRRLAGNYARLCDELAKQGKTVVIATVSMFDSVRDWNRQQMANYHEFYLKVSLEILKKRDQKGLYSAASEDDQHHIEGISIAYEEPKNADLVFIDELKSPDRVADEIIGHITNCYDRCG